MGRRSLVLGSLAAMAGANGAAAQGFAGMGRRVAGYADPDPTYRFAFPKDHGAHPNFRIEWWYITANLTDATGAAYGVQWTLFRSALRPDAAGDGWQNGQAWMGHAGLTSVDRHFATERLARGGISQAGVVAQPFEAWIDEWHLAGPTLSNVQMRAAGPDFAFDLGLQADRPFVPQGLDGYSVKSAAGQASHYYSQPFYRANGVLKLPAGDVVVTGRAWLDREWSSQPLEESQTGWDWFSLHLGTGDKLMGFRLRDGARTDFTAATWIAADGTPTPLPDGAFQAEPLAQTALPDREVPTTWAVRLPQKQLDVTVTALNPQAWMGLSFPYWEGPVSVSGSHDGVGYLEMTGYE